MTWPVMRGMIGAFDWMLSELMIDDLMEGAAITCYLFLKMTWSFRGSCCTTSWMQPVDLFIGNCGYNMKNDD